MLFPIAFLFFFSLFLTPIFFHLFPMFSLRHPKKLVNPPLSVNGDNVKFGSCSLESDKYITVCESSGSVAMIDLTAGNSITRQTISAEAAIMNPLSKVLALKGIAHFHFYYFFPTLD